MRNKNKAVLINLIKKWERSMKYAFASASGQIDDPTHRPTGKQFIEHGGICYFNCAQNLKEALQHLEKESLIIPSPLRRLWHRLFP